MSLQKVLFKPGLNRENTRYTTEGGWYDCDKVRFRQGNPEVIGGWQPFSGYTYQGVCRSLWNWVTLGFLNLIGVGTNLKFYVNKGGYYYDITPIRTTTTLGANPFTANGTTTVTVTAPSHGCVTGDFVTFSGATGTYSSTLNAEFQVVVVSANSYTITTPSALTAGSYGGAAVVAAYQLNVGPEYAVPQTGWGAGAWGAGTWGNGTTSLSPLRLWNQMNYGQDLVYGPRGGGLYYWNANSGVTVRGVALDTLGGTVTITIASPAVVTATILLTEGAAIQFATTGALPTGITAGTTYYVYNVNGLTFQLLDGSGNIVNTSGVQSGTQSISNLVDVPIVQNNLTVSDTSRFVMVMGTNDYGSSTLDPMLIRWSNQDDIYNWTPDATNQAGSIRLSHGSQIVTYVQTRQEIVVLTDASVYSLQYLGPPYVWQSQLLGDNISIISPNAAVIASGVVYWMGVDKFYLYDGRVQTLSCDLRRFIYSNINLGQAEQVFCSTNEGFNEVWWFYPSTNSEEVDSYVIYNYLENNYIIFCTKQGTIKKTTLKAYSNVRAGGVNAIEIRENDELVQVSMTNGKSEIVIATKAGKAIRFNEETVRPVGRNSVGVRGVSLEDGKDEVVGMVTVNTENKDETIMVLSEKGYGKRSYLNDPETGEEVYRITNRGGKGVKTISVTDKTGFLIAILNVTDNDHVMIINKSGIAIRMAVEQLRVMGRAAQGVRVIRLNEKDEIAAVAKIENGKLNYNAEEDGELGAAEDSGTQNTE